MEFFRNPNVDWLGKKWYFIAFSFFLSAMGLVSLIAKGGPRYGIDFRGGTLVHVKFRQTPAMDDIRKALDSQGLGDSTIQRYGAENTNEILIGLDINSANEKDLESGKQKIVDALLKQYGGSAKPNFNEASPLTMADKLAAAGIPGDQARQVAQAITDVRDAPPHSGLVASFDDLGSIPGVTPQVISALQNNYSIGAFAVRNVEIVGPKVGAALRKQALNATLLALASMLVYVAFRFEWIYGVAAVVATFHDVVIAVGFLSLFNKEITLTVIAALLTLVGYSMNDTIVVFDRIRENVKVMRRDGMTRIVNTSINQTLSRTVLTSGLTFISVLALLLFGGEVLRGFAFTLVVGILVGTYSSIAVGSTLVVSWEEYKNRDRRGGGSGKPQGGRVVAIDPEPGKPKRQQVGARAKA